MNWKVILLSALMCSSIVAGDVDDEVSDDDEVLGPNGQALTGKDKLRQIQINLYHHKNKTDHKKKKKKKNNLFVTYTTTTSMSTSFVSSTTEVTGICAKLVNVTGACRRRRGQWVDEPIVMSFDDNMDMLDSAFSPSKTYSIETTVPPEPPPQLSDAANRRKVRDIELTTIEPVIESSTGYLDEDGVEVDPSTLPELADDVEHRLGFQQFFQNIRNVLTYRLLTIRRTQFETVTATSTISSTVSTNTFFIQLCTPSPFTFEICSHTA